jgi:hypothetical protein
MSDVLAVDLPNGIAASCCDKILVGTNGQPIDLFLDVSFCPVA